MAEKIIHEKGKYLDVTPFHGKWCTITLNGVDIGYAGVGIISSGRDYILFQYKDKKGLVFKAYIKDITEVHMSERRLRKQQPLVVREWDDSVNPFEYFIGTRCNIHVHATKWYDGNPGFFDAKILYVGEGIVRIRENSKEFNVNQYMICGLMES